MRTTLVTHSARVARTACIALGATFAFAFALAACSTKNPSVQEFEKFDRNSSFTKHFDVSANHSCDAARRALLSQGYVVDEARGGNLKGHKQFQPDGDQHVEVAFAVVCVPDDFDGNQSSIYVSATQDNYTRKKIAQSASVGVGPLGSVSLPFGSTDDSLVKIASATIGAPAFYQRFFSLVDHYARQRAARAPAPEPAPVAAPVTALASPHASSTSAAPAQSPAVTVPAPTSRTATAAPSGATSGSDPASNSSSSTALPVKPDAPVPTATAATPAALPTAVSGTQDTLEVALPAATRPATPSTKHATTVEATTSLPVATPDQARQQHMEPGAPDAALTPQPVDPSLLRAGNASNADVMSQPDSPASTVTEPLKETAPVAPGTQP